MIQKCGKKSQELGKVKSFSLVFKYYHSSSMRENHRVHNQWLW